MWCNLAALQAAPGLRAFNQRDVRMGMDDKQGAAAILECRARYLGEHSLQEAEYDQALLAAGRLEHSGSVSASEWVQMVRQANAALLRQK